MKAEARLARRCAAARGRESDRGMGSGGSVAGTEKKRKKEVFCGEGREKPERDRRSGLTKWRQGWRGEERDGKGGGLLYSTAPAQIYVYS